MDKSNRYGNFQTSNRGKQEQHRQHGQIGNFKQTNLDEEEEDGKGVEVDLSGHPDGTHLQVEDGVRAGGEDRTDVVRVGGAGVVDVDKVGGQPRAQEALFDKAKCRLVIRL